MLFRFADAVNANLIVVKNFPAAPAQGISILGRQNEKAPAAEKYYDLSYYRMALSKSNP